MKLFTLILANAALLTAQGVGASLKPVWAPILPPELKQSKQLEPGKFVYYDPEINDYVIRYKPLNKEEPVSVRFKSPNRASAEFKSDFAAVGAGPSRPIRYTWRMRNLPLSPESIRSFNFAVPKSESSLTCDASGLGLVQIQTADPPISAQPIAPPGPQLNLSLGDTRYIMFGLRDMQAKGRPPTSLKPGAPTIQISCASSYLPGWIAVYYAAGEETSLDADTPKEVQDQLASLTKFEQIYASGMTFGPKYPPASPAEIIAMDFLIGITNFEATTQLSPASAYVRAVKEQLTLLTQGAKGLVPINTPPSTDWERELDKVLKLALPAFR
jgi:hypothetical protein